MKKLKEYYLQNSHLEWIIGNGWNRSWFEFGQIPTASLLDSVVPDKPCILVCFDGHSLWVNSKALELKNIHDSSSFQVSNAKLEVDSAGKPTGLILDQSLYLFGDVLEVGTSYDNSSTPLEKRLKALEIGLKMLNSYGITSFQDALVRPGTVEAYKIYYKSRTLTSRASLSLWWSPDLNQNENLKWINEASQNEVPYGLRIKTIKVMLDGVVETKTAFLKEPYSHCSSHGMCSFEEKRLIEDFKILDSLGFQIHIHAIGDAATHLALNAFEETQKKNGPSKNRHHIAHLQIVDPQDLPRFHQLNVCANFQPFWACPDDDMYEMTKPLIGNIRFQWQYPIKTILNSGAHIGFGSDFFVSPLNPLEGIQVAVTRNLLDCSKDPFLPAEIISLKEAINAYTMGSAYMNHLDQETGSLEVGKFADFIVLDTNLFEIAQSEIHKVKVIKTFIDGKCIYERK